MVFVLVRRYLLPSVTETVSDSSPQRARSKGEQRLFKLMVALNGGAGRPCEGG